MKIHIETGESGFKGELEDYGWYRFGKVAFFCLFIISTILIGIISHGLNQESVYIGNPPFLEHNYLQARDEGYSYTDITRAAANAGYPDWTAYEFVTNKSNFIVHFAMLFFVQCFVFWLLAKIILYIVVKK